MQEENKWKYSNRNLNFLDYTNKINNCDELDKFFKKELENTFDSAIKYKYEQYKHFLFEYNLFLFEDLKYNIKESVYCLIIGVHTASITNTNLILERALKLALIQYQAENIADYSDNKIIDKYIESDKAFSSKSLDKNITKCQKLKILNAEEAKELQEYKLKFRDGFSHFTPRHILKGEENLTHIEGSNNSTFNKISQLTISQANEVRQFAVNNAGNHLTYVLKIVNHLQYKVLEKFSEKK